MATASQNFTLIVPNGTTNHGDPNLLCTPTTWSSSFIFFATNYIAHAITVKQVPGEDLFQYSFAILAAVFYPYVGLGRGLESIFRRAIFYRSDPIKMATRAGALCIVIRSRSWKPDRRQKSLRGVRVLKNDRQNPRTSIFGQLASQPADSESGENSTPHRKSVTFRVNSTALDQLNIPKPTTVSERKLHGLGLPPDGYELAMLPVNAMVKANVDGGSSEIYVSSSYNLAQVLVSIFQLIASLITLYRARGDQLTRYGYAAFGLTVIPYITMSAVNLVGNLMTPNYESMYLVHSPELDEARERGGKFDGYVGTIVKLEGSKVDKLEKRVATFEESDPGFVIRVHKAEDRSEENTAVEPNTTDSHDGGNHAEEVHEENPSPEPPKAAESSVSGQNEIEYCWGLLRRDPNYPLGTATIEIPVCSPFQTSGQKSKVMGSIMWPFYFFLAIPLATIGGLTRFHVQHSTKPQRVWMMTWLIFDAVFGFLFGVMDQKDHDDLAAFIILLFLAAPAIGGFVVVGQMLKEYGDCIDIVHGF